MEKTLMEHAVGEVFLGFLFIKGVTRGIASNGSPFLTLTLQDKSGEMDAKYWNVAEKEEALYVAGKVIKVQADVHEFKGRKQLKISRIRPSIPEDHVSIEDFVEKAPLEKSDMEVEVFAYIGAIQNPGIKDITTYLVEKYKDAFLTFPAATKNHHELVSGLAYHVVSMLRLAKEVATLYSSLNKDLLYAGIILHDLGKVTELSGPTATTYTLPGNLLGHITLMVSEIAMAAEKLGIEVGSEEVLVLQHIVLSHHGKAEWGSPKSPLIKEAEIIHYIDNLDAKINMLDRALAHTEQGEYTERIFPLENRSFYNPNL